MKIMESMLKDCEEILLSNLEQLEKAKLLVRNAIDALRKAQHSLGQLPLMESQKDLVAYIIGQMGNHANAQAVESNVTTEEVKLTVENEEKPTLDNFAGEQVAEELDLADRELKESDPQLQVDAETPLRKDKPHGSMDEEKGELKLQTEGYRYPDLTIAEKIKVDVASSLANDGSFWCVPCTPDLRKQQNQISESVKSAVCNQRSVTTVKVVQMDCLYCVFSKSENLWLRALVEKELDDGQVQLRYVDTGTQENFVLSRLTPLPDELSRPGFLAFCCSMFPEFKDKLPYESKWMFSDLTKGALTYLYVEPGFSSGMEPLACFKLEKGDDGSDIREEVRKSVQQYSKDKEDFPLPAKDIRQFESPPSTEESALPQGTENVVDESNKKEEVEVKGIADGIPIAAAHSNRDLVAEKDPKVSRSKEMSWADMCSSGEEAEEMDFSVLKEFPLLGASSGETEEGSVGSDSGGHVTSDFPGKTENGVKSRGVSDKQELNLTDETSGVDDAAQESKRGVDGQGKSFHRSGRQPERQVNLPSANGTKSKALTQANTTPENESDREEVKRVGSARQGGNEMNSQLFPNRRSDREDRYDQGGFAVEPKTSGNYRERVRCGKPQWRFNIRRLGLQANLPRQKWLELQSKGLRFRTLYNKSARYVVLWTTQQRLEYLFRYNDFTPMLENAQVMEGLLQTFDKQPIFIVFVRFERRYNNNSNYFAGVGLVTSPLFRDEVKNTIKFECDLLCTATQRQQINPPYEDGQEISFEEGVRLIESMKESIKAGDVEDSLDCKGELQFPSKVHRREEKGYVSPNNARLPPATYSASRRPDLPSHNNSKLDFESENWDGEANAQRPKMAEPRQRSVYNTQRNPGVDLERTPVVMQSSSADSTRDIQAEMEMFGLDENDVL